jgi:iron complex outermembrane recepter protein
VSTRRDGVLDNVRTGRAANTIGTQAVRGQLLFKPDDTIQMRVIADFTNFQAYCCGQVYLRTGTSLRAANRQFGGPNGLAAQFGYAPPSTNVYDRKTDIDGPLGVDTNEGGVSAITDWNLGPVTLTSVSAWRFWNWDAENDRDYTGLPVQLSQHIPSRQDQYSQELRLASNGTGPFSYVVGLYGFRQRLTGRPISIYGPAAARYLIGTTVVDRHRSRTVVTTPVPSNLLDGYGQDGRTDFRSLSYAAFGEVNYRVFDRLTATAGLRYTQEEKDGYYATTVSGGPSTTNAALVSTRASACCARKAMKHMTATVACRAAATWRGRSPTRRWLMPAMRVGSNRAESTCRACRLTATTGRCWRPPSCGPSATRPMRSA